MPVSQRLYAVHAGISPKPWIAFVAMIKTQQFPTDRWIASALELQPNGATIRLLPWSSILSIELRAPGSLHLGDHSAIPVSTSIAVGGGTASTDAVTRLAPGTIEVQGWRTGRLCVQGGVGVAASLGGPVSVRLDFTRGATRFPLDTSVAEFGMGWLNRTSVSVALVVTAGASDRD